MSELNSASGTAPLTTMASAMFFGMIFFATTAMAVKAWSHGDTRALQAAANPRASALDLRSFPSVYTFLYNMSFLGLIMFYAYLCEYHPPFPHAPKSYDRDEFFFMTALLIVISLYTLKKNDPTVGVTSSSKDGSSSSTAKTLSSSDSWNSDSHTTITANNQRQVAPVNEKTEVLNRDQTEEWKGWMQFMFLLYHYYHAEEVYNAIRVMITCYVWMTGFGNFSFFYIKGDYGSVRVMQMLWRLNFLVAFLCLTQGTTYILYYICLLHTYYFLMVYVTMRVAKQVNYSKMGIRIKIFLVGVIIFVVWDLKSPLFWLLHRPFLGEQPMLGATSGAMWEWYFRSSLDHWSTFMGMTFALNFPITSLLYRKLEAEPLWKQIVAKSAMGLAFLAATVWWVVVPFRHGKFDYNMSNAYFAWIPLYSYIYFRNLTPWLRNHTLDLLHQIGKTTLETYLMQHHIWLTSDAKSLLTLIPGWPMMNFLLVSIIYVVLSRKLYQLTLFLRGMVLPNERYSCIRNLVGLAGVIGAYVALAFVLRLVGLLNLFSVLVVAAVSGLALYRYVIETTWSTYSDSSTPGHSLLSSLPMAKIKTHLSPTAGAMAVVVCGVVWHHMARTGASKIIPLPKHCESYVQQGAWISVDACNEGSRGEAYRDYDVSSFGTCSPLEKSYVWGWKKTAPSTLCRFVQRDSSSLLKTLNHRKATFIGDSTIRHMFHATRRVVGDRNAGAYNTTIEKWSDFPTQNYKNFGIDFVWAPFTDLLISSVQSLSIQSEKPDLIVIGGGAWDRLHRYNNESEQLNLKKEVLSLAQELKNLKSNGVPVVWMTPTTINTWALMTDAKKQHIKEENIADLRKLYQNQGIHNAVSFVLDGPSFTADRVSESYDGVHYPIGVYDAGAQILANSLDWLLVGEPKIDKFVTPSPGKMAHPFLGLFVLAVAFVIIFFMDGLLGISYLAGLVVPSVRPVNLHDEAFSWLHAKMGLPSINSSVHSVSSAAARGEDREEENGHTERSYKSKSSEHGADHSEDDDELNALLNDVSEDGPPSEIRSV